MTLDESLQPALCEQMVLHAFVTSRIDYCNGFLYGLPDCEIAKLQS